MILGLFKKFIQRPQSNFRKIAFDNCYYVMCFILMLLLSDKIFFGSETYLTQFILFS